MEISESVLLRRCDAPCDDDAFKLLSTNTSFVEYNSNNFSHVDKNNRNGEQRKSLFQIFQSKNTKHSFFITDIHE